MLVAGPNFGSGSSREHAPWSLQDWGFEAIIAPSFADIFYSNCTKVGLLPIVLPPDDVNALMAIAQEPANKITVDLETQTVKADGFSTSFEIDSFTKHCLLNGLDEIALTLARTDEIDEYEQHRPSHRPTICA